MGLFADILKGLPENAVLRDKIAEAEKRYGALGTENAILKDDLRDAKAEIKKLKKQVEEFTHKDDLNEIEREALKLVAKLETEAHSDVLAIALTLPQTKADYYLHNLEQSGYIGSVSFGGPPLYYLEQKGRAYLVENNLI